MIIDAANTMFNQENTSVTVRMAQSGDIVVQPTTPPVQNPRPVEQKTESKPAQTANATQTIKKDIAQENIKNEKEIQRLESDQEKMVLDLFDGKYVE